MREQRKPTVKRHHEGFSIRRWQTVTKPGGRRYVYLHVVAPDNSHRKLYLGRTTDA